MGPEKHSFKSLSRIKQKLTDSEVGKKTLNVTICFSPGVNSASFINCFFLLTVHVADIAICQREDFTLSAVALTITSERISCTKLCKTKFKF